MSAIIEKEKINCETGHSYLYSICQLFLFLLLFYLVVVLFWRTYTSVSELKLHKNNIVIFPAKKCFLVECASAMKMFPYPTTL